MTQQGYTPHPDVPRPLKDYRYDDGCDSCRTRQRADLKNGSTDLIASNKKQYNPIASAFETPMTSLPTQGGSFPTLRPQDPPVYVSRDRRLRRHFTLNPAHYRSPRYPCPVLVREDSPAKCDAKGAKRRTRIPALRRRRQYMVRYSWGAPRPTRGPPGSPVTGVPSGQKC